ncbi:hypothetical protein [Streptomyces cyanogenus]|uniref:Caspase domain-containing protein n=1 Tax=Streptomyces cyanogenus TaxID=80860 RepID=A0ABX7U3T9_STRCY|nr:hypothetical protein [Streptomyces cyanogenus]QTD95747.1 hypothetical protein S1361_00240 [Streptomyces cyanogenus]QTE03243.1 hypothetical protein S1361_38260 [Streptomyces cyanogenus]
MTATAVRHLLVGVSSYEDAALELPAGTAHNVAQLREALTASQHHHDDASSMAPRACRVLEPGDASQVLDEVAAVAQEQPSLVVYWTGHAAITPEDGVCLALPHSRVDDLSTWMPADLLIESMSPRVDERWDRLLILDACLGAGQSTAGGRSDVDVSEVVTSMGRPGVAVWAGLGRTATGFAANSRDTSVFTQVLAHLLLRAAESMTPLKLQAAHEWLVQELERSGYPPPCLGNAGAFRSFLAQASDPAPQRRRADRLVRRALGRLVPADTRRYALVCGMALWGAREQDTSPYKNAVWLYERLLASGWGFTRDTTTVVGSVTRQELRSKISELASQGQNLVLVYLSGAARVFSERDSLDVMVALAEEQSVSVSELVEMLRTSRAERVTLLIDAYQSHTQTAVADRLAAVAQACGWAPAAGASRLAITWATSPAASGPDPLALTAQGSALTDEQGWGDLLYSLPGTGHWPRPWRFSFPEAEIRYLPGSGPLAAWQTLLGSLREPSADASVAQWLLSVNPAGVGDVPSDPFAGLVPPPAVPPASSPPPEAKSSARLRVVGGTYPAAAGREILLAFDYQSHQPGTVPVCGDDPLDLTVVVSADDAAVEPRLFYTRVDRDAGTPTQCIRLTPRTGTPVKVQLSVMRRGDGALLQELTTVLPAAAPENAALS